MTNWTVIRKSKDHTRELQFDNRPNWVRTSSYKHYIDLSYYVHINRCEEHMLGRYLIVITLFLITHACQSMATNPMDGNDAYADPDHDGIPNIIEYEWNTDPLNPDSDNDGLPDGFEIMYRGDRYITEGLNPMDPADAYRDYDWNTVEYIPGENGSIGKYTTLPYTNYDEYLRMNIDGKWSPSNPLSGDTDSDGILDPDDPYPCTLFCDNRNESHDQEITKEGNENRYEIIIKLNEIDGESNKTCKNIVFRRGEMLMLDFDIGIQDDPSTSCFPESFPGAPFNLSMIWINIYFINAPTLCTELDGHLDEIKGNSKLSTRINIPEMNDIVRIEGDMRYYNVRIQTTVPDGMVLENTAIWASINIEDQDLIPYGDDWFVSC